MNLFLRHFILAFMLAGAVLSAAATTLPYVEDFELTDGGFTSISPNSWKWGPPVSTEGPGAARSGTQVWGTNLNGSYANNLNAVLVSPDYDLSAAAGKHVILHWWQFLVTEESFDFADVQVSKDGGGTWETVLGPRHGVVDAQWTQHTVLLDPSFATTGFKVRFRLITDASEAEGGFYVDDIRVSTAAFTPVVSVEDFEADEGGYQEDGVNSSWQFGTPVSAPGGAFSGSNAWATRLNGFYNASENSTLTSPVLDLSAAAGKLIAVAWRQFFDTEQGYDFLDLEVSTNGGSTWQTALVQSGEVSVGGWSRMQAFLPASYASATFRLRFRFESDEAYQYDGVAIDDIVVLAAADLFPTVANFSQSAPENFIIPFTRANFEAGYTDPDGGKLEAVRILQLPAAGVLKLDGVAVTQDQVIAVAELGTLAYEPPPNSTGSWFFTYHAANFFAPSPPATVTLNILGATPLVVIAGHPQPVTVNPGAQVVLGVTAISSLPLSYQWRLDGEDIQGANGPTLMINTITEAQEGVYDVFVSNSGDSKTSDGALVSVNDPVTIAGEPGDSFVNEGGSITLSVLATGTGRIDYQWFKNGQLLLNETFSSLQITNAKENDGGTYQCLVTNIVGTKPTTPASLTVRLAPRIIANPVPIGTQKFRLVSFEVAVAGEGPFTYQWFRNGIEVLGATGPKLVIERPNETNMGNYTVKVSNGWATVESEPAELQVFVWSELAGTYQDVLERPGATAGQSTFPGLLTVKFGTFRMLSGVLAYDGGTHRFSGKFDISLVHERLIKRGNSRPPLRLRLQLNSITQRITATVTEDGAASASAVLPKFSYHRRNNPAPDAGRYTVILEPDGLAPAAPDAPAILTGVLGANGRARFTGRLPSGRVITSSTFLHVTGRLPFYRNLGRNSGGQVCGRLVMLRDGVVPVVRGGLIWRHLPGAPAAFMPDAFVTHLDADGSLYLPPVEPHPVLTLPVNVEQYVLNIDGPLAAGSLMRQVRIGIYSRFRISPETDARVHLELKRRTGFVVGSFVDVVTGRRHVTHAVVNQFRQSLAGSFRTPTQPGSVRMVPLVQ